MPYLQIFLYVDVFFIGVLATIAVRHGFAHLNLKKLSLPKGHTASQGGHLPPSVREHLLEEAQIGFRSVLNQSAKELQKDLEDTATEINKLVEKMGTEAVATELERYRAKLEKLTEDAEEKIGGAGAEIAEHQGNLKAKLEEEMAAEKQRLLAQIDTRLADAVSSFLIETMQHDVDLGAQTAYITKMLEEHKQEFTKGVADEAAAS
ncbi:MAG TPA: OmpH family outer membrane protein [Patescibacteria group bacterium]|nr:OmpH family outer membrane protein [Patescibacteria group bacterium]